MFTGHQHTFERLLLRCSWSPDGKRVAAGSADRIVYVWDAASCELAYALPGHKGSVNEVVFHPKVRACSTQHAALPAARGATCRAQRRLQRTSPRAARSTACSTQRRAQPVAASSAQPYAAAASAIHLKLQTQLSLPSAYPHYRRSRSWAAPAATAPSTWGRSRQSKAPAAAQ